MLTIVIQNGKAVSIPDGSIGRLMLTDVPPKHIANNALLDLIRIVVIILIIYIAFKFVLPFFARYLGYLVSQFKKGVKESK